jgi:hypothetical protein
MLLCMLALQLAAGCRLKGYRQQLAAAGRCRRHYFSQDRGEDAWMDAEPEAGLVLAFVTDLADDSGQRFSASK